MLCSKQHEQEFVDINLSLATVLNDLNLALQPLYDVSAGCLNGVHHAPYMPVGLYVAICMFSCCCQQVAALPTQTSFFLATSLVTMSPLPLLTICNDRHRAFSAQTAWAPQGVLQPAPLSPYPLFPTCNHRHRAFSAQTVWAPQQGRRDAPHQHPPVPPVLMASR